MRKVADFMDEDTETSKIVSKLMMKRAAQRDQGKVEVMHYCVEGKSYSTSFRVRNINLNPKFSVALSFNSQSKKFKRCDYLSFYKLRPPSQKQVSFDEFTKLYQLSRSGELIPLTTDNLKTDVRRFIPKFPSNPRGKNYQKYCKFQLLRFKPWQDLSEIIHDIDGDDDSQPESYVREYHDFLKTDQVVKAQDDWAQELQNAESVIQVLDQGEAIEVDWEVDDTQTFLNRNYFDKLVTDDLLTIERNPTIQQNSLSLDYKHKDIYEDGYTYESLDTFVSSINQQL